MARRILLALSLGVLLAFTGVALTGCGPAKETEEMCSYYKRCTGFPGTKGCRKNMNICLEDFGNEEEMNAECLAKAKEIAASKPDKAADYCMDLCAICD